MMGGGRRRCWQPQFEQGLVLGFVHAYIHTYSTQGNVCVECVCL